jgi:threonine aldolase
VNDIDLRSDTVTRPDDRMRDAARDAEVGDDVYREDTSVNELERRAAETVGMEAALYVPTGTMGNQVAARAHTQRGQEVLVELESHIYKWELAGLAQHSSLQVRTADAGQRAVPTPEQIRDGYVEADAHRPGTGLVCLENTHNSRGGVAAGPDAIDAAAETATDLGVPVHLDGARVFNAAVARDTTAERICRTVDTVMFCLSKGLGAPVGSVLAGPEGFVESARKVRKLLGGGMRQAGVVAAPGLVALANVDRLVEDHEHARLLANRLDGVGGFSVSDPDTNIVLIDTEDAGMTAGEFLDICESAGVLGTEFDTHVARFCTHLDVDREDVLAAVDRIEEAIAD